MINNIHAGVYLVMVVQYHVLEALIHDHNYHNFIINKFASHIILNTILSLYIYAKLNCKRASGTQSSVSACVLAMHAGRLLLHAEIK